MFYIGVDLGGTGIKAGVVNEQGAIVAKASCPTGVERGYGPVIADMAKLCIEAAEKANVSMDDVAGIGVGIIDISTMYGVGAIVRSKSIDMEVHLEMWQAGKEYDRLGMTENYTEILGVQIPYLLLPIHPGRNLAVVLEVAARNFRLKQMGHNAAMELARRHMERAQRASEEDEE